MIPLFCRWELRGGVNVRPSQPGTGAIVTGGWPLCNTHLCGHSLSYQGVDILLNKTQYSGSECPMKCMVSVLRVKEDLSQPDDDLELYLDKLEPFLMKTA